MTNKDFIQLYINSNDVYEGKNGNLTIKNNHLYSYNTCIAVKISKYHILINTTKYSKTTTHHENMCIGTCQSKGMNIVFINNVPIETQTLTI